MNAKTWFNKAIDSVAEALDAKSAAERRLHGRNAIDALLVAASLGNHDALLKLGIYYQHGAFGILPARLDLAEHWLRLAVTANDGTGMLALATLLMKTGRKAEGRRWLRKALAHGEGGAACHLGREIEANSPSRALRLYLKGAALGDPFAAVCAGMLLERRNSRKALLQAEALYKKAVRKRLRGADEDLERVRRLLTRTSPKIPRSAATRRSR
jgi:TPR repeat protein